MSPLGVAGDESPDLIVQDRSPGNDSELVEANSNCPGISPIRSRWRREIVPRFRPCTNWILFYFPGTIMQRDEKGFGYAFQIVNLELLHGSQSLRAFRLLDSKALASAKLWRGVKKGKEQGGGDELGGKDWSKRRCLPWVNSRHSSRAAEPPQRSTEGFQCRDSGFFASLKTRRFSAQNRCCKSLGFSNLFRR